MPPADCVNTRLSRQPPRIQDTTLKISIHPHIAMASQDDAGAFTRPAAQEIQCATRPCQANPRAAWKALFSDPMLSASSLKAEAMGAGLGPAGADGGVILRSVYWRVGRPPSQLTAVLLGAPPHARRARSLSPGASRRAQKLRRSARALPRRARRALGSGLYRR
jgi:hypothetical protein